MNVVSVLAPDGTPLMPSSCAVARFLLKEGKAKVKRRMPFTIKWLVQPETMYTQLSTLGIDMGSSVIGSAVADSRERVVYLSEVEGRNNIVSAMKAWASYRRKRRNRKTRYRKARWLNRRNSIKTGRISLTMRGKIETNLREIRFVQSLLPIGSIILEAGTFDPHALKKPEILKHKCLYQKGTNYDFANTKAYVLTRDSYTCKQRQGASKERRLEGHHIVFRSQNGSDEEVNLITLCKTCHDALHTGAIALKRKGKKKGSLHYATQMNSIRLQLLKQVQAEETKRYLAKEHRQLLGLPKERCFYAAVIAKEAQSQSFVPPRSLQNAVVLIRTTQRAKDSHWQDQRVSEV